MKKVIYLEWSVKLHAKLIKDLQNTLNLEPIYITTTPELESEYQGLFPNAKIHNCWKAKVNIGLPEFETQYSGYLETFRELQNIIPQVFAMLDRFDILKKLSYYERKRYVDKAFNYWYNVFIKLKPDFLFFCTSPHTCYDFIAMHIALKLEIKVISFEALNIDPHQILLPYINNKPVFVFRDEIEPELLKQNIEYEKRVKNQNYFLPKNEIGLSKALHVKKNRYSIFTINNIGRIIRGLIFKTQPKITAIYLYRKPNLELIHKSGRLNYLYFLLYRTKIFNLIKKRKAIYSKLAIKPNLKTKYIYFPLNYQPEKTTNPLGELFFDALNAVKLLWKHTGEDTLIYLKVHPNLFNPTLFNLEYNYNDFLLSERVKFITLEGINNYELIDKSLCTATVNGTTSFESIFRLKKSIVFGTPAYCNAPGIYIARNDEQMQNAISEIEKNDKITNKELEDYINLISKMYEVYIDDIKHFSNKMTYEKNIENAVELISKVI